MKAFLFCVVQALLVFGKQSRRVRDVAVETTVEKYVHRLTKRAAGQQPGTNLKSYRQDQLNVHNYYRNLHGVSAITLDNTLNAEAQSYAEHLARHDAFAYCRHDACNPSRAGENIAISLKDTASEVNATLRWYEEVLYYNYCSFPNGRATTRPNHEGKTARHFTQVVWSQSTKLGIGCARNVQTNKMYVVGRYLPSGNIIGHYEYNVPKARYLLNIFQDNCNGINGRFTNWSKPSVCSRSCGRGVQLQYRTCTNPKPSFNGRDCIGDTKKVYPYWCNTQDCVQTMSERDEQCQERGYIPKSHHFKNDWECTLFCQADINRIDFFLRKGFVDDGTYCQGSNGTCIDGTCVLLREQPSVTKRPIQPSATKRPIQPSVTKPPTKPSVTKPPTKPSVTKPPTKPSVTKPPIQPSVTKRPIQPSVTKPPIEPSTTSVRRRTTTTPRVKPSPVVIIPPVTTRPTIIKPPTFPKVVDGGWTKWSNPRQCSKRCGGGISYQDRTCTNPSPSNGGRPCTGPNTQLVTVWCNPQPCHPTLNDRDQQCRKRGFKAESHNFKGPDECLLHCQDFQSDVYHERGPVDNGTHCNAHTGVCIANECVQMTYEPGTLIKGMYMLTPSENYHKNIVLEIPNGATNIVITNHRPVVEIVVGFRSAYSYGYNKYGYVSGVDIVYNSAHVTIKGPVKPPSDYEIVVYALGKHQAFIEFQYNP